MVANEVVAAAAVVEEPAPASAGAVDPMRLASRWRSPAEWGAAAAEMEAEPAPSELNTTNSSGLFAVVSTDRMSVRYLGVNQHGHDVGVVQANRPAPTRRAVYYFEMGVKNAGQKGQTSIGFTTENFKMRRQPGLASPLPLLSLGSAVSSSTMLLAIRNVYILVLRKCHSFMVATEF
jgi:hypothetical protein